VGIEDRCGDHAHVVAGTPVELGELIGAVRQLGEQRVEPARLGAGRLAVGGAPSHRAAEAAPDG